MHLLGAMLCLPSEARGRSQPGSYGLFAIRHLRLIQCSTTVEEEDLQVLERFAVVMYDRSSVVTGVTRLNLFAHKKMAYHQQMIL